MLIKYEKLLSGPSLSKNTQSERVWSTFWGINGWIGSHGAGGGPSGRLGPLRSFDWRTERSSGLWNLAFLARGAEIMALSSGRGPTFYSPHTHPTPAHSEGIWLCSQSAKKMFDVRRGMMDSVKVWSSDAPSASDTEAFPGDWKVSKCATQKWSSALRLNVKACHTLRVCVCRSQSCCWTLCLHIFDFHKLTNTETGNSGFGGWMIMLSNASEIRIILRQWWWLFIFTEWLKAEPGVHTVEMSESRLCKNKNLQLPCT